MQRGCDLSSLRLFPWIMDFSFCKTLLWWLQTESSGTVLSFSKSKVLCVAVGLETSVCLQPPKCRICGALLPSEPRLGLSTASGFWSLTLSGVPVLIIQKQGWGVAALFCSQPGLTMFSSFHSMDLHGYFALLTKASKVQQTQATVPQSQTNNIKAANHTISFITAKRGNTRGMRLSQTFVDSCLFYDCSSVCNDLMLQDSLIVTPWISSGASDCSDID